MYQTWDLFDLGCKSRSLTLGTTNRQEVNDVVHPKKNNLKKVLIDGFIIFLISEADERDDTGDNIRKKITKNN